MEKNNAWKKVIQFSTALVGGAVGILFSNYIMSKPKAEISWHRETVNEISFDSPFKLVPEAFKEKLPPEAEAAIKKIQQFGAVKSGNTKMMVLSTTYADSTPVSLEGAAQGSIGSLAQVVKDPTPVPQFQKISGKNFNGYIANYNPSTEKSLSVRAAYVQSGQTIYMVILMITNNELTESEAFKILDSIRLSGS